MFVCVWGGFMCVYVGVFMCVYMCVCGCVGECLCVGGCGCVCVQVGECLCVAVCVYVLTDHVAFINMSLSDIFSHPANVATPQLRSL